MAAVLARYLGGGVRITREVEEASAWVGYELLAVGWSSLLPLGLVVGGVLAALVPGLRARGRRAGLGALALLLPFAALAGGMAPEGATRPWHLLAFAWLAFAHWLPHRLRGGDADALRDGLVALGACARRAVRVWTVTTASFLLSVVFVLPLEPLLGVEMPSVDHGQRFMLVGMGVLYFVLNALLEALPWERWIARAGARRVRAPA
jgi:hypothetical protein